MDRIARIRWVSRDSASVICNAIVRTTAAIVCNEIEEKGEKEVEKEEEEEKSK